jgi:DNA-binding NarL/FixJ family response regulator
LTWGAGVKRRAFQNKSLTECEVAVIRQQSAGWKNKDLSLMFNREAATVEKIVQDILKRLDAANWRNLPRSSLQSGISNHP